MDGGILNANLIISISGLVICILGLIQVSVGFRHDRKTKRFFILFFSCLIAYVSMNLLEHLTDASPEAGMIPKIAMFLESTISSVLMLLLSGFLLDSCGIEEKKASSTHHIICTVADLYGTTDLHAVHDSDLLL